jgi:hypothetical protein
MRRHVLQAEQVGELVGQLDPPVRTHNHRLRRRAGGQCIGAAVGIQQHGGARTGAQPDEQHRTAQRDQQRDDRTGGDRRSIGNLDHRVVPSFMFQLLGQALACAKPGRR